MTEMTSHFSAYVVRRAGSSAIFGAGTSAEAARIDGARAAGAWAPVKVLLDIRYAPLRFPDAIVADESQHAEFWIEPIDLSAGFC